MQHTLPKPRPGQSRPAHRLAVARRGVAVSAVALAVAAGVAGCGSDTAGSEAAGDQNQVLDTTAAPAEVTWRPYQGLAVPYSTTGGPSSGISSAAPTGYSRTPQGAVLAAIQGQARLALAPDSAWAAATATLVAAGAGRDAYAIARAGASITTAADPAATASFTGFRITDYQPEKAELDVATRMPGGQLTSVPVTVLWRGDDWKLALPNPSADSAGGQWDAPAATDPVSLTSLDGFTAFAAS